MNFAADVLDFLFTEISGCRTILPKHFRVPNHTRRGSQPRLVLVK